MILHKLAAAFAAADPPLLLFEVGGSVRDTLLGLPVTDLDVVVCSAFGAARPLQEDLNAVESVLKKFGEVKRVGRAFPVFQVYTSANMKVDVALPRTETSTGPGHQQFTLKMGLHVPIEMDLLRRDFTINAIAKDPLTGEFIDPSGGLEDIKKRKLRMVFSGTFQEDPLRILRLLRFKSQKNFNIENATLDEAAKAAKLLGVLSSERISDELIKLLQARYLKSLKEDIRILPWNFAKLFQIDTGDSCGQTEFMVFNYHNPDVLSTLPQGVKQDLQIVTALVPKARNNTLTARRLVGSFPRNRPTFVIFCAADALRLITGHSVSYMQLYSATSDPILPHDKHELALSGQDLINCGLNGRAIGEKQQELLNLVWDKNIPNTPESLKQFI